MTQRSAAPIRRLAALLYDLLLIVALWFVLNMLAVAVNHGNAPEAGNLALQAAMITTAFLFFVVSWRFGGQTPGMKAWQIRLTVANHEVAASLARLSAYAALSLTGNLLFGANLIAAQLHPRHVSPAEKLTDIRVVRWQQKD